MNVRRIAPSSLTVVVSSSSGPETTLSVVYYYAACSISCACVGIGGRTSDVADGGTRGTLNMRAGPGNAG